MTGLVTSPITGCLVLGALLFVLLRRGLAEARGLPRSESSWVLVPLVALFLGQVAARFLLL